MSVVWETLALDLNESAEQLDHKCGPQYTCPATVLDTYVRAQQVSQDDFEHHCGRVEVTLPRYSSVPLCLQYIYQSIKFECPTSYSFLELTCWMM